MEGPVAKKKKTDGGTEDIGEDESFAFPLARVRRLMQTVSDCTFSAESVREMCRVTEKFVGDLAEKSLQFTHAAKRKTVNVTDFAQALALHENLGFLQESGALDLSADSQRPSADNLMNAAPLS